MIGFNRPESLRQVDHYKRLIDEICRQQLEPGAIQVVEAGTKIAAYAYKVWEEGERPEVAKDFWQEVGMTRGKTPMTRLVNYLVDSIPRDLRRVVQEVQNQITSTLCWLTANWKPLHSPTYEEVLAKIQEVGIHEYHRRWMSHLSAQSAEEREATARRIDAGKRLEREEQAKSRGMTVAELDALEAREAEDRKSREDEARWAEYVNSGIAVNDDWADEGLIYIRSGTKLIRVADAHCQRIRACMVR